MINGNEPAESLQHTCRTVKRISITGPESTGKSSLAKALAEHFGTSWVPEYAREYLNSLDRPYEFGDIVQIARGQYFSEKKIKDKVKDYLFCDTDMLVCKIWSEFKYGRVDPWIAKMAMEHRYDLYLLCDIDLPWVQDPMREHPHRRKELFDLYLSELRGMPVRFEVISGTGDERISNAISAIERTFRKD